MSGVANLHTVWLYGFLCVRCKGCQTRKMLAPDQVHANRANMERVRDLKLKCSACGGTDIERIIPASAAAAQRFIEGADIPSVSAI